MTNYILAFLREVKAKIGQPKRILEVGSLNVNGSAREVFQEGAEVYQGIDLVEGEGVDLVMDIKDYNSNYHDFDLIICCETLEHDPTFWLSVEKMKKLLKPGGWLIITTPGFHFGEHKYPRDYYRFMMDTYQDVFFKGMRNFYIEEFSSYGGEAGKPDWVGGYAQK
jgi:SAM-dependent methyltransferase